MDRLTSIRKPNKKAKAEKSNAGKNKARLTSAKEEEPAANDEGNSDIGVVKNLGTDEFDRKFEMMLVCLLNINS
jgi:hypothetical protein